MRPTTENKFYIQSIDRAFSIIDIVSKSGQNGLALTSISDKVKLPLSTTYRIIQNLISWGYVKEDEDGNYSLGFELIILGNAAENNIAIKNIAHKYISELGDITKETIYLSILDDVKNEIVYIDKIESKGNIKLAAGIGSRNPIHTTASGKALISQFTDEKIRTIFKDCKMARHTKTTICDIGTFINEIHDVQARGYAIDNAENEPGVRCVAAPIFDYKSKIAGSVSLSGVLSNITIESIHDKYASLVKDTARKISIELGCKR